MTKQNNTAQNWLHQFEHRLDSHTKLAQTDPQANPVKLLAYDISKDIETRALAFRDIEALVKLISDRSAVLRAKRLRTRCGMDDPETLETELEHIIQEKSKLGFETFKSWAQDAGQGIVLTAHPTFSLSKSIRETLGAIASETGAELENLIEALKTYPYLPKRAPTLREEHAATQSTIVRIQDAIERINHQFLIATKAQFPKRWTEITPRLIKLYSWVGYDIDGRTDIGWGDAIRLKLSEKRDQLARYLNTAKSIEAKFEFPGKGKTVLHEIISKLESAYESAVKDVTLFEKDLTDHANLVDAANNLTRQSGRRLRSTKTLYPLLQSVIDNTDDDNALMALMSFKAALFNFGLGTSRIHFRLNVRHVIDGVKSAFGIEAHTVDNRTLIERASKKIKSVRPKTVNFASLEMETNTAHRQMILTAQIHKYIDDETPIRLLIAECEDSLVPLGMLYLAKLYKLDEYLDISPLFETANALNNGGRIIGKMLSNPVYKAYIKKRGTMAIQTGFSDAGRFMGQIPATLAIERLQSHFAAELARHGMSDVTAIIFNTHGESLGRGGHPGTIGERLDYVMSPWAMHQFESRSLSFCHETSFQGGDGFMWFQTVRLAYASSLSLLTSRWQDTAKAAQDIFYKDRDFSWDVFRTLSSQQNALYNDPNYTSLLGGFGQNLLTPTGSRATKRAAGDQKSETSNPRQIRAIPHNAILQQYGVLANIFYGLGRASQIDPDKFTQLYSQSARARSILTLATTAMQRSNISILSAYGRLFDPGFWVSRALSGSEPHLTENCLTIAESLARHGMHSKSTDLATRLRMDVVSSVRAFKACAKEDGTEIDFSDDHSLQILHALRLAVLMKMNIIAAGLPVHGTQNTSRFTVLQRLHYLQIDSVLEDLRMLYPEKRKSREWTKGLTEKADEDTKPNVGYLHLVETITKPLERAAQLTRQITIAITHNYDAFG